MGKSFLYESEVPVTPDLSIYIPTVGEVISNEDDYYSLVMSFTSMPIDMMVALDDQGIDFTKINEYDLFLLLFPGIAASDTSLIFKNVDLASFEKEFNEETNMYVLVNHEQGITIDRLVHNAIANTLRKMHNMKKNIKKPGNEEARQYLIELERKRMRRRKRKGNDSSQLEELIIGMVNTEEFKYNYEETKDLSIYQFTKSVNQIVHKKDSLSKIYGIYSGTLDAKRLKQSDLNWVTNK